MILPRPTNRIATLGALIFLICTFSASIKAQKLSLGQKFSPYTFIYKLDLEQALELARTKSVKDTFDYYTHPYDSIPNGVNEERKPLPPGMYLQVAPKDNQIHFSTVTVPMLDVRVQGWGSEILVLVYDLDGKTIKDAKVKLEEMEASYREDCDCYSFPRQERFSSKPGILEVSKGEAFQVDYVSYNPMVKPPKQKKSGQRKNLFAPKMTTGYMVVPQPKYRTLDTVNLSAFLVKSNGKPIKKKVQLLMYSQNQTFFRDTLEPEYPGAYKTDIFLSDSLPLDRIYNLAFYRRSRRLRSVQFRLEDYELRKASFKVSHDLATYPAGTPVVFRAEARDVNGWPLLDARVHVKVRMLSFGNYYQDSMFVPYEWSKKFYETEKLLEVSGTTPITIPDSLFPNAAMNFEVTFLFTDANQEQHTIVKKFTYDGKSTFYRLKEENGRIKGGIFVNSKPEPGKGTLVLYHHNRVLEKKDVSLPLDEKVNTYATAYQLLINDSLHATLGLGSNHQNPVLVGGVGSDSLRIDMVNPLNIPVSYALYLNGEKVEGGRSETISIRREASGEDSWYITYSYRWASRIFRYHKGFHVKEKALNVAVKQPEKIYPGQEVPISVKVTNFQGKPMKGVNMTAYAVNGQFDHIPDPDMPYFGKVHQEQNPAFTVSVTGLSVKSYPAISRLLYDRFGLENSPYHRLVYAEGGVGEVREELKSGGPEFAPFVMQKGKPSKVFAVYLNQKPVYLAGSYLDQPYSIRTTPGTYRVDIRTFNHMYTVEGVELKNKEKLFLGLNADSALANDRVSYVEMVRPYQEEPEWKAVEPYFLCMENLKEWPLYVVQDSLVLGNVRSNSYGNIYFNNNRSGYMIGPLKPGNVTFYFPKDTINLYYQPGFVYQFQKDTLIELEAGPAKNVTNAQRWANSNAAWALTDTALSLPTPVKVEPQQRVQKRPKPVHPLLRRYYKPANHPEISQINFRRLGKKSIVRVWLIDPDSLENSQFFFNFQSTVSRIIPGKYDLLVATNDSSFLYYKNYDILPKGTHYQTLRTEEFQEFDSLLIDSLEHLIIKLNEPPLNEFHNYPTYEKKPDLSYLSTREGKLVLSGELRSSLNSPINGVLIIAEVNGKFKGGAITNSAGKFAIKDLAPGTYTLKVLPSLTSGFTIIEAVRLLPGRDASIVYKFPELSPEDISFNVEDYAIVEADRAYYSSSGASDVQMSVQKLEAKSIRAIPVLAGEADVLASLQVLPGVISTSALRRVGAAANRPEKNINQLDQKAAEERERLNELAADSSANRLRSHFRDHAFWRPHMYSDSRGEVHFSVRFPDNITLWKTYVPAMDKKKHSGLGRAETKSYKPLSAQLGIPRFLIQGDKAYAQGTLLNYTGVNQKVTTSFSRNEDEKNLGEQQVENIRKEFILLQPEKIGALKVIYKMKATNGYLDGEKRELKVLPNGLVTNRGNLFEVEKDTAFTLMPNTNLISRKVFITNSRVDLILREIEELKRYNYGCNEQTASKLKALLAEKQLKASLGQEFEDEKVILKCLKILRKSQQKTGSWGWWKESQPDYWMTVYVAQALNQAAQAGYRTREHARAAEYLKNNLGKLPFSEQIETLELLASMNYTFDFEKYIKRWKTYNLSLQDHFRFLALQQSLGDTIAIDTVLATYEGDAKKGTKWGEQVLNFKTNHWQTSMEAYKVLRQDTSDQKNLLRSTRKFFLESPSTNRNTLERASLIETFIVDLIEEEEQEEELTGRLTVNGKLRNPDYPIRLYPKPTDTLAVEKSGAPLFFSIYEEVFDRDPTVTDSLYKVTTWLIQEGDTNQDLYLGKPVSMEVELMAHKKSEYVMVEVHIPAGCSYGDKSQGKHYREVHREYQRDKVAIFFKSLPQGRVRFSIALEPRFKGEYTLLPTKAEMMYFPLQNGINGKRTVVIKDRK